jgi:hypothetical protein
MQQLQRHLQHAGEIPSLLQRAQERQPHQRESIERPGSHGHPTLFGRFANKGGRQKLIQRLQIAPAKSIQYATFVFILEHRWALLI